MMRTDLNGYSRRWFEFFHVGIDEARTIQETEFVCRSAPLPDFRKILDVCCGMGRHARALSNRGYSVTAVDRDAHAIAKAQEIGAGPNYVVGDIRDDRLDLGAFDAAIVMGQSFGHFDAKNNRNVLDRLMGAIRNNGRIILDLWNPQFFEAHQGEREFKTPGGVVRESKRVNGDRLFVQLDYPDGAHEQFEWQLFAPVQIEQLTESIDLDVIVSCSDFDIAISPSPAKPRIQFLLQRR